jgi:phenylacetate-CoA ligase
MLSAKGYSLVALTPGTNMGEIRRCLTEVSPLFDQTVLCGYPPFLRDVIDELVPIEIDPTEVSLKMLMAGEPISESWRDDMAAKLHMDSPLTDCISMYGTADAGIVGFETQASIQVRRFLSDSPEKRLAALGGQGLPSIFEYQPYRLRVEPNSDLVLLTVLATHPHFRYSIGDSGTATTYAELHSKAGTPSPIVGHPLVALHGRTDHTVSFFGGNVYPEHISAYLDHQDRRQEVTGRFTMLVQHDAGGNRPLTIVVELQPGVDESSELEGRLAEGLETHLLAVNSEYANYVPKRYQRPEVTLRPHKDQEFFARGKKQEYVKRGS